MQQNQSGTNPSPQPRPNHPGAAHNSSLELESATTPGDTQSSGIQQLIDQVRGLADSIKTGTQLNSDALLNLRVDIQALSKEIERGGQTKSSLELNPELVAALQDAVTSVTGHLEAERKNSAAITGSLQAVGSKLETLSQQLAKLQIGSVIEKLESLTSAIQNQTSLSEDLVRQVLQGLTALGGSSRLDEQQYQNIQETIKKFNAQCEANAATLSTQAESITTLLELIREDLQSLQKTKNPSDTKFKDLKTMDQKRALLDEIEAIENTGALGELNVKKFIDLLNSEKFIDIKGYKIKRKIFEVDYQNTDHQQPGQPPKEFKVSNSTADAYKAASMHKWAAALSWGSFIAGASAVVLGGTPIIVTAGITAIPMVLSGMWNGILWQQSSSKFDEGFGINLDQKTSAALSPQKMILETLSTYSLIQKLPYDAKILDWGVSQGGNNSSDTALSTLLTAMKNTIKHWDEFRLNIPDLDRREKNPGDMAQLRDREFDQNIERFKPWLPRIRNSFLRYPLGWSTALDYGSAVGGVLGAVGFLGGGLPWLLKFL